MSEYLHSFYLSIQMTPLHMAVKEGCIKIVKYLVDKGASINIQDNEGVNIDDKISFAALC